MSILNFRPLRRARRHEQVWRHRSGPVLCLPVLAVALLAFVLPQAAGAAEWHAAGFEPEGITFWTNSRFESTDCTSQSGSNPKCIAVGEYSNRLTEEHLLLGAHGYTEYTQDLIPSPGEHPVLKAVSCDAVAGTCQAVGSYGPEGKSRKPFAESSTEGEGGRIEWKLETAPSPTGAVSAELTGVSCVHGVGGTTCTAVGKWENSSKVRSIFAVQRKAEWKLQTIANPSEVSEIPEAAVSCGALSNGIVKCEMAGDYIKTSKAKQLFAENWNGTAWSLQSIPTPAKASALAVSGASCGPSPISVFECTMVGGWVEEVSESKKTLAERWNGTEWKIQESKNSTGAENYLTAVSCPEHKQCFAVGPVGAANSAAAEHWNGTVWEIQKTAQPKAVLLGVSCRGSLTPECGSAGMSEKAYVEFYR